MKIEVTERFNNRDPGAVFEAKDADAKKWIKNGLAKKMKEEKTPSTGSGPDGKKDEKKKAADAPKKDKQVKNAPVKK